MTVVCLGSGPSTTTADLDRLRGQQVIAINSMYRLAPWAAVLYAADSIWWQFNDGAKDFAGRKFGSEAFISTLYADVTVLPITGRVGLEMQPWGIRTSGHSGYQAINLAVHLGAKKIVLVGYDMQAGPRGEHHIHPDHPHGRHLPYDDYVRNYETMRPMLDAHDIDVVNCSRSTAITAFRRSDLDTEL